MRLQWKHLRGLGNSRLLRASAIIPVVGYLILLNGQLAHLVALDPNLRIDEPSYPWRLVLIYAGAWFITLGSAIYYLWCPRLIRLYEDPIAYGERERTYHFIQLNYRSKVTEVTRRLIENEEKEILGFGPPAKIDDYALDEDGATSRLTTLMTMEWHLDNNAKVLALWLSAIAFGIGIVLWAIPTVQTAVQVIGSVAHQLTAGFGGA